MSEEDRHVTEEARCSGDTENGDITQETGFCEGMDEFDAVSGMISALGNGITIMHEPRYFCLGGVRRTFDPEDGFGLELMFYEGSPDDPLELQVSALGNTVDLGRLCGYQVGGCTVAIPHRIDLTGLGLTPLDGLEVIVDGHSVTAHDERTSIGFSEGIQSRFHKDFDTLAFRSDCRVMMRPSPEIEVYRRFGVNIIAADPGVRVGRYILLDDRVTWPTVRGHDGILALPPKFDYPAGWDIFRSVFDDPNGAKRIILKNDYKNNIHPSYRREHFPANRLLGDVRVVYARKGFFLKIPPYEKMAGEETDMKLCYGRTTYPLDAGIVIPMGGCEHITQQFVDLSEIMRSPLEGFAITVNGRVVFKSPSRQVMLFDRRGVQVDSLCGEGYVVSDHTHKLVAEGMKYLESGFSVGCRISRVYIPYEKALEMAGAEYPEMAEIVPEDRGSGFVRMKAGNPKEAPAPRDTGKEAPRKPEIPTVEPMPRKDISDMDFGNFLKDTDYDRFEERLRDMLSKVGREVCGSRGPSHGLIMEPACLRCPDSRILVTFGGYECGKDEGLDVLVHQAGRTVRVRGRPGVYDTGGCFVTGLFDMCPGHMGLDPLGGIRVTVDGHTVADIPRSDYVCFDRGGRLVSDEGAASVWYRPGFTAVVNGEPAAYTESDGLKVTKIGGTDTFCIRPYEKTDDPAAEDGDTGEDIGGRPETDGEGSTPEDAVPEEPTAAHEPEAAGAAITSYGSKPRGPPETVADATVSISKPKAQDTEPHFAEGGVTMRLDKSHIVLDVPPYIGRKGDNFLAEIRTRECYLQAGLLAGREGTSPPRTRVSRIDLTVLDVPPTEPFALLIDGKEVFSWNSRFAAFDRDGMAVTDGRPAYLVTSPDDRVRIECRGSYRREEAFGLAVFDLSGCRDVRFSVRRNRTRRETETRDPWFSMDGRRCLLNLPRYPETDDGTAVTLEYNGRSIPVSGSPEGEGDVWISFAPSELGVCPLDIFEVCLDGDPVYTSRDQVMMMFGADGRRLRYPEDDVTVVCRPTSRFDYRGCRVIDGEDTEVLMMRRLEVGAGSAFHVKPPSGEYAPPKDRLRRGFDKLTPRIMYYDGDITVSMPRYYGERDAPMECWLVQDGREGEKVKLNRIDRPWGTETVPAYIPLLSAGMDPLGGFDLLLDGEVIMTERARDRMMFCNNGLPVNEPYGETLVVSRPDSIIDAGGSEVIDEMETGDLKFTQLDVPSRYKVYVNYPRPPEPEEEPVPAEEPEPVQEPEPVCEEVPETEPEEPVESPAEDSGEEPVPAERIPSRDISTLSFDDFFGVREDDACDMEELYHMDVPRRFQDRYPNLFFDMDHMTLEISRYTGGHNDPFECWFVQGGRESERFTLESVPREYDRITEIRRADLGALGVDPFADFDLYIDGRKAYYYRSPGVLFFDNAGRRMPRPLGETLVVCPAEGSLDIRNAERLDELVDGGIRYALYSVSYTGSIWYHPPEPPEAPQEASDGDLPGSDVVPEETELPEDGPGNLPEDVRAEETAEPGPGSEPKPRTPVVTAEDGDVPDADDANLVYSAFRFCIELPSYDGPRDGRFELSLDAGNKIIPLGRMKFISIPGGRRSVPTRIYLDELGLSPFNTLEVSIDNTVVFSKEADDRIIMNSDFRMVSALAGYRNVIYPKDSIPDWGGLEPRRRSVVGNMVILTVDAGPEAWFSVSRKFTQNKELAFVNEKPDVVYRDGSFLLHMPPMRAVGDQPLEVSIRHQGRTVPVCILGQNTSVTAPRDINLTDIGASPLDGFEVIVDGQRMHINWETAYMMMDSSGHRTIMPSGRGYAVYRPSDEYNMFEIGVLHTKLVGGCVVSEISASAESRFVPVTKIINTITEECGREVRGDATASIRMLDAPSEFEAYWDDTRVFLYSVYPEVEVSVSGCDSADCRVRVVNRNEETVFGPVHVIDGRMTLNTYNAKGPLTVQVIAGERVLGSETYIHDYTFYYQVPEGHILGSEDVVRFCAGSKVYSFSAYDGGGIGKAFPIQGVNVWLKWKVPMARITVGGNYVPYDVLNRVCIPAPRACTVKTRVDLPCSFMIGNKSMGFVKADVREEKSGYVLRCRRQTEKFGPGKYEVYMTMRGYAPLMIMRMEYSPGLPPLKGIVWSWRDGGLEYLTEPEDGEDNGFMD